MTYTDNPAADAERYYAEQEAQMERLPRCSYCGCRIQDETLCDFGDEVICLSCLNQHFIKWTDDYIN